jgi:hypothetical protein
MTAQGEVKEMPGIDVNGAATTARGVAAQAVSDARELGEAGDEYRDAVAVHERVAVAARVVAKQLDQVDGDGDGGAQIKRQ